MVVVTTVTRKGQVTIPKRFRDQLDISEGQKVKFELASDGELKVKPVQDITSFRGAFKSRKKYDKQKARKLFIKDVLAGKV